jgi:hypothetical protein
MNGLDMTPEDLNNSLVATLYSAQNMRLPRLLRRLPRLLRLQVFHNLSYKDYSLTSITCQTFKNDLAFSLERNFVLPCLHVPSDYTTLNEAYERVEQSNGLVTTIIIGKGEHIVEKKEEVEHDNYLIEVDNEHYLIIKCPVNIVGSPNVLASTIIVRGGFIIDANGVHVEHLTIRAISDEMGVYGCSSFTLNELIIEQCGGGVSASGSSTIGRCCNIVIRKCKCSGVEAEWGASVILEGSETSIYENCSENCIGDYGLRVSYPSSKIQIVSPLTKEKVSKNNNGGGNWNPTLI